MILFPGLSELGFAALFLTTILAACVQRLSGMGFGTIVAPIAALIAVEYTPASILLLGVPISAAGMGLDLRRDQISEIAPAVLGRLLATIPAVFVVEALAGGGGIGVFIALAILAGVALGLLGVSVEKTRTSLFCAGGLSGFLATISSVGAAPMALIYQNDAAKAARGGLNAFFFLGLLFAIAGLAAKGLIEPHHVRLALFLSPAIGVGLLVAWPLAKYVDGGALKPWALGLSSAAALTLLAKSLLG